jgi:hypothetical protein
MMADLYHQMSRQQLQAAQNHYSQQGYINSPNSLTPQAILVRLCDEDVQRIVQGVLDGMQERWGRRSDDA